VLLVMLFVVVAAVETLRFVTRWEALQGDDWWWCWILHTCMGCCAGALAQAVCRQRLNLCLPHQGIMWLGWLGCCAAGFLALVRVPHQLWSPTNALSTVFAGLPRAGFVC
jgi:hypothetical protein